MRNNKRRRPRAKNISKREAQRRARQSWRNRELLLRDEVEHVTRLSDTTIWRLEKQGLFPDRIKIGFRRVAWRTADIDAFVRGTWQGAEVIPA
jgi:prophage regulatory protein